MTSASLGETQVVPAFIRTASERGRLAHAYLLYGGARNSLESAALATVMYILGKGGKEVTERTREQIVNEEHPDVYWIYPEGIAGIIRVQRVKTILEKISMSPSLGPNHFVIVAEAEKLNRESANTLLKALEEPAGKTIFLVLAGNPARVLGTVKSRCQPVRINDSGESDFDPALYAAARETITETLFKIHETREVTYLFDLAEKLHRDMQAMKKKKDDDLPRRYLRMIVSIVLCWYRDLAMLKCGVRDGLECPDMTGRLESFLAMDRGAGGWSVVQDLEEFTFKTESNLNTRLFLDNLLITATRMGLTDR